MCANRTVSTIVDFGLHPPANRFIAKDSLEKDEDIYPLGIGYCSSCKNIQLSCRMPMQEIRPRFDWIAYQEPEQHLDEVARHLFRLPGIGSASRILGVTYKDQSTLDRLLRLGTSPGVCLSKEDFSIFRDPELVLNAEEKHIPVDLLIARHIAEHALDAVGLIRKLKKLIAPEGYLVIEVPDCEKFLRTGNHAFVWEEHLSYFTQESLLVLAEKIEARIVWFARYPYPYEDSLVAAFQWIPNSQKLDATLHQSPGIETVGDLLQRFKQSLSASKSEWRARLQAYRDQGHRLAVFGAGHLAAKWINFLCVSDLIDCVIDDHPNKIGMYMPGSKLPILPSSALCETGIKVCISTLSPESERKVRTKLSHYFDHGGMFISAFI